MTIRRWGAGERITARRLNQSVDVLNGLVGLLPARLRDQVADGARKALEKEATDEEADGTAEDVVIDEETVEDMALRDEKWVFVGATQVTNRITDADDSETFVDVTTTTKIVFVRPDGSLVSLPLTATA